MGQGEALSPPPVGTTFAGLTDDQRLAVLDYLGYMPLYNFAVLESANPPGDQRQCDDDRVDAGLGRATRTPSSR
jgi:hypothetical protein